MFTGSDPSGRSASVKPPRCRMIAVRHPSAMDSIMAPSASTSGVDVPTAPETCPVTFTVDVPISVHVSVHVNDNMVSVPVKSAPGIAPGRPHHHATTKGE